MSFEAEAYLINMLVDFLLFYKMDKNSPLESALYSNYTAGGKEIHDTVFAALRFVPDGSAVLNDALLQSHRHYFGEKL